MFINSILQFLLRLPLVFKHFPRGPGCLDESILYHISE